MREVHFEPGEHVSRAANRLVLFAKQNNTPAFGLFNEIRMETDGTKSADEIIESWQKAVDANVEAYRNSPEGIAAARRDAAEVAAMQEIYDQQVRNISDINWADPRSILAWLRVLQPPSDRVGVIKHSIPQIHEVFAKNGFLPGMNCGDAFAKGNSENELHWLVGQALDGLEKVAIHGMFHSFADKWEEKFSK